MNQFIITLLLILGVLLIGDLFLLRRILKKIKTNDKTNYDEKYFELKYDINLLKSVSAILIFVLGFLGYSNFQDFKKEMEKNINENIAAQRAETDQIKQAIVDYKQSMDSLNKFKDNLQKLISLNDKDLSRLSNKVTDINSSFKYNPRVYIVDNLIYPYGEADKADTVRFYFKNMKTIHGEELPEFDKIPFVVVQGQKIGIDLLDVNTNSVLVNATIFYGDAKSYNFNLWIGSPQ